VAPRPTPSRLSAVDPAASAQRRPRGRPLAAWRRTAARPSPIRGGKGRRGAGPHRERDRL